MIRLVLAVLLAYWVGRSDAPVHTCPPPPKPILTTDQQGEMCTAWWFGNDPRDKSTTARRMCGKKR